MLRAHERLKFQPLGIQRALQEELAFLKKKEKCGRSLLALFLKKIQLQYPPLISFFLLKYFVFVCILYSVISNILVRAIPQL